MKVKIILILLFIQFFFGMNLVVAQSNQTGASASPTIKSTKIAEDEIKNFKDKIASKVAELTKEDQKAISGYVTKLAENQLSIKTDDNQIFQIKIDDILTKIYRISNNQKNEIKLSKIKKDDYLVVNGPTSETTVSANYIFVDEQYLVDVGKITEVDKENYSLKIITSDKETISLDIETLTKQTILDIKTLELNRIGFSKIKEGDTIHFVVRKSLPNIDKTNFSAIKILIIPQEYFIK